VLTLTSAWQKFVIVPPGANVPDTTGKFVGECGNDGLFLQVQYPFDAQTSMDFTMPSAYMGNIVPGTNFLPNDAIESVMYNPRTGYVTQGYDVETMGGWVPMNDAGIGNSNSLALTRANIDVFPLYNLLYTNVTIPSANAFCTVTGYTGNAINDFLAGFFMQLPLAMGRVFATYGTGAGLTAHILGSALGAETITLTNSEMPQTVAVATNTDFTNAGAAAGGSFNVAAGGTANWTKGGGTAISSQPPTSYNATFIKL